MKEGYFINYNNGKVIQVEEHETWLRTQGNAKRLGVPDNVMRAASKFKPIRDRDKFLMFIMQNSPIMRMRGHGDYVTFEYASHDRQDPMDAIWLWGKKNAGPYTQIYINNLETGENTQTRFEQFEELMDSGGAEAVMRAASVQPIRRKIVAELLELSKQLLRNTMSVFL